MPGTNLFSEDTSTLDVALTDKNGLYYFIKSTGVPPTTANKFAHGCLAIRSDSGTGNSALYENVGSSAVPSWDLLSGISAGSITLAEGNILVGNAGAVATALNAKTTGQILVGNGTTVTSVAVSGDITLNSAGLTGIATGVIVNADVSGSAAIDYSKLAALTSGNILVGSAGNVATSVAMSGNATISNAGVVTVTGSTGSFSVGTTLITGNTTTSTGAGAVAVTGCIHEVTTTGTGDALTLANGTEGQRLAVVYVAEGAGGDTAVLTPTNLAGAATTITFNAVGDTADLLFTAGTWFFMGGSAIVA